MVLKRKKANVIVGDLELNQEKVVHLNRCRKVPGLENCLDESTLTVTQESDFDQTSC